MLRRSLPPAVMSQTSFPFQNGPMAFSMTRLSPSFFARTGIRDPIPRSKPSSMK